MYDVIHRSADTPSNRIHIKPLATQPPFVSASATMRTTTVDGDARSPPPRPPHHSFTEPTTCKEEDDGAAPPPPKLGLLARYSRWSHDRPWTGFGIVLSVVLSMGAVVGGANLATFYTDESDKVRRATRAVIPSSPPPSFLFILFFSLGLLVPAHAVFLEYESLALW